MSRGLKIGLFVAVILAIIVLGGWYIVMRIIGITDALIVPVERQLAALKAGDMQAAYVETSQAFQQATPMDAFVTFVDQFPALKDAAEYSFPERSISNGEGRLRGTLTSSTGAVTPIVYQLVKENDVWKIIYINVNPVD